jgi:hypothetical protein
MGTYDTLTIVGPSRLVCAAGHPLTTFQTKDFREPSMDSYALRGTVLFLGERNEEGNTWVDAGDELISRREERFRRVTDVGGPIAIYTHCEVCAPVVFERDSLSWDHLDERRPWVEYELLFARGELIDLKPLRVESRADVRLDLEKSGVGVLPDDDRLVRRHLALRERGGGRRRGLF